jgi:hypothetical protein
MVAAQEECTEFVTDSAKLAGQGEALESAYISDPLFDAQVMRMERDILGKVIGILSGPPR